MEALLLIAAVAFCAWAYRAHRRRAYPLRLVEYRRALEVQAELWAHRNPGSPPAANERAHWAEALRTAQPLLNDSPANVAAQLPELRPTLLHLTSEAVLHAADIYYSDRRQPTVEAVWDLIEALDRKSQRSPDHSADTL